MNEDDLEQNLEQADQDRIQLHMGLGSIPARETALFWIGMYKQLATNTSAAVQGFLFESVAEHGSDLGARNDTVCKIVRRASYVEASEHDVLDQGPAFLVRFSDGHEEIAYAHELSPWYPTS